jgi:hypothetical protein
MQPISTFFTWDRINFALRQWVAAMLTLYICFALQIESPYWALLTVWIVAQPAPGMVLAKSMYFVCGTIVGAILGFTLIALFAQAPELFVLCLALLVQSSDQFSRLRDRIDRLHCWYRGGGCDQFPRPGFLHRSGEGHIHYHWYFLQHRGDGNIRAPSLGSSGAREIASAFERRGSPGSLFLEGRQ